MAKEDEDKSMDRRGFLECMAWVGTGAVWPEQPSFILHTGDLTHLSKPAEFDTLQQVLSELSLPVYVPGERDR